MKTVFNLVLIAVVAIVFLEIFHRPVETPVNYEQSFIIPEPEPADSSTPIEKRRIPKEQLINHLGEWTILHGSKVFESFDLVINTSRRPYKPRSVNFGVKVFKTREEAEHEIVLAQEPGLRPVQVNENIREYIK